MTYAELIAEIKLLSNRGDIDDKIALALRSTTLRAHRSDFYWRDLVEVDITGFSGNSIVVDTTTDFTRFRQVNYVRYLDPNTGCVGKMLDEVEPSNMVDDDNCMKTDIWYLAGTALKVRTCYVTTGLRAAYWQNPDVTPAGYNSWIKEELPDILVRGALAVIYNQTGKQEEARAINRMVGFEVDPNNKYPGQTLLDELRGSNLRGTGRAF